jgi:hypothetical protein
MAPTTVRGKWTNKKMANIRMIVVMGKAAVEFLFQATVFTQEKTRPNGIGKTDAVSTTFHTQLLPFNCLNILPATMPPITPHKAYIKITAVNNAPLLVALNTPRRTHTNNNKTVENICAPEPINAENKFSNCGDLNTSPCIIFHPVSSSVNSSSSTSMYLEKSFFKILINMIAKKAVSKRTRTKEFIIDNQWISNVVGRNVESAYRFIRWIYAISGV